MPEAEKYIAKRINKDASPGAVQADGTRIMLPGEMTDALNCRIDIDGVVRSIQGNVLSTYVELGAGNNKVIGTFAYAKYNTIIGFIYNDMGNHRVFEWNPGTGVFVTLLQGSSLNFQAGFEINSGGVIDDLLIWNDAFNPIRFINLIAAKAGLYTPPYTKYRLSLATQPPLDPPTFEILTDNTLPLNNIAKSTFQFAYNFMYADNRESSYGPLSLLAWVRPYNEPDDNRDNVIDVTITIPAVLIGYITQVNIAYREGNLGLYNIFETIKNPTLTTYTRRFNNNGKSIPVSSEDQNLLFDTIPVVTKTMEIIRNRLFCPVNNDGFDVDESMFDFSVAIGTETIVITDTDNDSRYEYDNKRYLKNGGTYGLGIVFYDDFGKMTFVKKAKDITVPYTPLGKKENKQFINWTLTGTPPAGFTKYQFVLSPNRFHSAYFQFIPVIHLYQRDIKEGETNNSQDTNTYTWQGKRFVKLEKWHEWYLQFLLDPNFRPPEYYRYVYLQMPTNVPFIPDTKCLIRFQEGWGRKFCAINAVIGEFIVIDLFSFEPYPADSRIDRTPIDWISYHFEIEVFVPAANFDSVFYEIGSVHNIVGGAFQDLSGRINGDTYTLKLSSQGGWELSPLDIVLGAPIVTNVSSAYNSLSVIESPSGIFASTVASVTIPKRTFHRSSRGSERPGSTPTGGFAVTTGTDTEQKIVYSLDYEKIGSDWGRVHTIADTERKKDFYNIIAYSNPYVENTFVNGLNRFLPENQYPLPIDRGPVIALKKAGNVLLAIHERFTSTLYIGEGLVRQNQDFILAKTESVVGDDRELQGGYGTINPESVVEVAGNAYWWDGYRGAVVRYTNAGLFAVSDYGMFNYFLAKSRQLLPYRNVVRVVTAFDYLNNELIITFNDVVVDGLLIIPGETWAFNTRSNDWRSRYSFVPERYASTETDLVSFKIGQLWHHHKNSLFNNFYGVQYGRMWRFVSNPRLGKNKRWLNIHIKGEVAVDQDLQAVKIMTKEGQLSYIPAYEFQLEEGKYVAAILKDVNTPVEVGQLPLRSGDDIVSEYAEIEVINDRVDASECSQVNVVYKVEEFSI